MTITNGIVLAVLASVLWGNTVGWWFHLWIVIIPFHTPRKYINTDILLSLLDCIKSKPYPSGSLMCKNVLPDLSLRYRFCYVNEWLLSSLFCHCFCYLLSYLHVCYLIISPHVAVCNHTLLWLLYFLSSLSKESVPSRYTCGKLLCFL